MGLAIDPQFSINKFVYIDYNYTGASYNPPLNHNVYLKIVRYIYNPSTDRLESPVILMDGIKLFDGYHDGGKLLIADNHIFVTIGDAKQVENPELHPYLTPSDPYLPQNLNVFNGKVLRLNLDGSVPADNPFAKAPYDKTPRNLIWSYGHRNTQGLVVGNGGKLYYAEHGRDNDDEMGIIKKGKNYGWPLIEGFCDQPFEIVSCDTILNHQVPLRSWNPNVAPSNMEYVADSPIGEFQNSILVGTLTGDNFGNHISVLSLNAAGDEVIYERKLFFQQYGRIRDLCLDPQGNIYFLTSNTTAGAGGAGDDKIMKIAFDSKKVITGVKKDAAWSVTLFPNPVASERQLNIKIGSGNGRLEIFNSQGVLMKSYLIADKEFKIDTSQFPSGVYIVHYSNGTNVMTQKIIIP
jgi:glucose/arabinose dehydrogenase